MSSLHVAYHPSTGMPYLFTFDKQEAWDTLYQYSAHLCHPDDVFERTLGDVQSYSTWDEMKFVIGENLTPEETEELYVMRRIFI